jgi:hypothetical protein
MLPRAVARKPEDDAMLYTVFRSVIGDPPQDGKTGSTGICVVH